MVCKIDGCPKPSWQMGWCSMHYARWRRHGDPGPAEQVKIRGRVCSVEGCENRHDSHGYCLTHSMRVRRRGNPGPVGKIKGSEHGHWKGDGITYSAAHDRIEADRGRASEWMCALCAVPAEAWAYTHAAENELTSPEGWPFSTDPDDYIPLCSSCHKTLDWSQTRQEVSTP